MKEFTKDDIRVGSYVIATGRVGNTLYKVLQIGTRLGGENSFLGEDLGKDYPCKQIVSCGSIKEIMNY